MTIKQLAAICGYSQATVSKALNGARDISEETKDKINKTAREVGYQPNQNARTIRTNRSNCLAVQFFDATGHGLSHEFFANIIQSFRNEAERLGFIILFIPMYLNNERVNPTEFCKRMQCDGAFMSSRFELTELQDLARSGIPCVALDYVFDNSSAVLSDNVEGMRELTEYIIAQGHKKIAYIHGEKTNVTSYRLASFYRCCKTHGIVIPSEYVREAAYHDPTSSTEQTKVLLNLPNPPTCIIYPDDFAFLGGMAEFERRGLKLGKDISAAGYDGILISGVLRPRLTTVRQGYEELGRQAAALLAEAINNPTTFIPRRVSVPCKLQIGESVIKL